MEPFFFLHFVSQNSVAFLPDVLDDTTRSDPSLLTTSIQSVQHGCIPTLFYGSLVSFPYHLPTYVDW